MSSTPSSFYSISHLKCPRCREGNLFFNNNPYNYRDFNKMPDRCPVCEQEYSPEPGFYFGATYVSYAFIVGIGIALSVPGFFLFGLSSDALMVLIPAVIIVVSPVLVLYSRAVWIHLFVRYRRPEDR